VSKKLQKKVRSNPNIAVPIYTFAAVWVLVTFLTNVSADAVGIAILAASSLAVSLAAFFLTREKKDRELESMLKSDFMKSGEQAANEVLEALHLLEELKTYHKVIQNEKVSKDVEGLVQVSKEILQRVTKKPQLVPSVRRFFNHHLPTMVKLVEDYGDMASQPTKGENILASMNKIENALEMLEDALKKKLDSLFSHTALDLEADVDVLENILKKDGFIDNHSMKTFKKENE